MKNILLLIITGALVTTSLTAQDTEKLAAGAKKAIKEADIDLAQREAEIDSAAGFEAFKKNADEQVLENSRKLTALKTKKYGNNKEAIELMFKKIIELEKRNDELGSRVNGYASTNGVTWLSFKRKFVNDMDQLRDEIRVIS